MKKEGGFFAKRVADNNNCEDTEDVEAGENCEAENEEEKFFEN